MNKMNISPKWILEKDGFYEDQPNRFSPVFTKLGTEYKILKFNKDGNYSIDYHNYDCVIVKGSIEFVDQFSKKNWMPGSWNNMNNLKCSSYYAHYGQYLLNKHYAFLPLSEIIRKKEEIFNVYGKNGKMFIRPDSGNKSFTGHVSRIDDFENKLKTMSYGNIDYNQLSLVASPEIIDEEYRFFIINKEIVSGCTYSIKGIYDEHTIYPIDAIELVNNIIKIDWQPSNVFVIDVCKSDNNYFLLELNGFNTADVYSCDIEKIVEKANAAAILDYNVRL